MSRMSEALALYVGKGISPYPKEDASRLASVYAPDDARDLQGQVDQLLRELEKIKPDWSAHTLASGAQWAVDQLKRTHPEIDRDAGKTLEWACAWWWR